jgi:hypothetical protein
MHFLLLWKKHPWETAMSDMKEIHKTIFKSPSSVATTIDIDQIRSSYDIFPLGCCDHTFCEHGCSFPFCFFNWLCSPVISQLYQSSISQLQELHKSCHIFPWEHVFPEFLTWNITYFQHSCNSRMESNATVPTARNKALCQWALHYCAVITTAADCE